MGKSPSPTISLEATPSTVLAIQTCYNLCDEQTRSREVNALVSLPRFMNISTALIISKDHEETLEREWLIIKITSYGNG